MKRYLLFMICLCSLFLFTGCGGEEEDTDVNVTNIFKSNYVVGKDIKEADITEFYYTVENINYDAFYQRYRFYVEDGKHMFFHERRERKNDYGWLTEADRVAMATMELSEDEWKSFYDLVCDGTVTARKDSADAGGQGPWTYLYWKADKGKYQVFDFVSRDALKSFEELCEKLEKAAGNELASSLPAEHIYGELDAFSYHPGYCDMNGESHSMRLGKDKNGVWTIESHDRENMEEPFITTVYAVETEDVEAFVDFLYEKDVFSLQERPESDLFITDYSFWNYSMDFADASGDKPKYTHFAIEEYKEYSDEDNKLLRELEERFEKLKGAVISETEEED